MKASEKNRLLSKYGFGTSKNFRKVNLLTVKENLKKHQESSICDEYENYEYYIVWVKGRGITSYVAQRCKLLACYGHPCKDVKEVEKLTKKYIDYLKFKNLEK